MSGLTRRDLLRAGATSAVGLYLPFGAQARSLSWHARASRARVGQRALDELRRRLTGRLLLPGEREYELLSTPANARYDGTRPVAVARAANERDVVTCVQWSAEHCVAPVARGGGHSYAGYSTTNGLLIDLGLLNAVALDKRTGIAAVGGAALNQDLFDATNGGHYILPGGTCLAVGVGGLVLGGGIGYNTHWAGLTSDHLRASRLVTAAGEVLRLDDSHHQDLFWACRGGAGGSFGINTAFTFQLVRIPVRTVGFYRFDWRGADAAQAVYAAFDQVLKTAPAAFNAVASAQAVPVGAGGPREAITMFSRGQYIGPLSELRELVAPLLAAATPVTTVLETKTYWDMQAMFASKEAQRHSFGDISRYAAEPLPDAAVAKVFDLLAACPSRTAEDNGSMWSLGWIGGNVVDSLGRRDTAYVHRNMLTLHRATPVWRLGAPKSVADGLLAWTNEMIATIAPDTPSESYQNFPNRAIRDWPREYYAENLPRLVKVKRRYDPGNLFRNAQSIPPR